MRTREGGASATTAAYECIGRETGPCVVEGWSRTSGEDARETGEGGDSSASRVEASDQRAPARRSEILGGVVNW